MTNSFTPGPWAVDAFNSGNVIAIKDGPSPSGKTYHDGRHRLLISRAWSSDGIDKPEGHEEIAANAHLIAAAPELLAALEGLENQIQQVRDGDRPYTGFDTELMDAAIAKARGQS